MECQIAVVILNYLNYRDTIECVKSILKQKYEIRGIVVVDNGSDNESYDVLKALFKKEKTVALVRVKKNLGYAKGNNIGIHYAREKMEADFVLVVNNDTIFTQKDFFQKMLQYYHDGVGVIGPRITTCWLKGEHKVRNYSGGGAFILQYLLFLSGSEGINWLSDSCARRLADISSRVVVHGCAMMFTPDFFNCYSGFYPHTFLYCEENIIEILVRKAGLVEIQAIDAELYHKGGKATLLCASREKSMRRVVRSMKHVLLVSILPVSILIKVCQGDREGMR